MRLLWVVILLGAFELSLAERILFVLPLPYKSHYLVNQQLMERLAEKGHEVTVIAPYKFSKPIPRITEIDIPDTSQMTFNALGADNSTKGALTMRNTNLMTFFVMKDLWKELMDSFIQHPSIRKLLESDQKFDLVAGEAFVAGALIAGLAHKYKAAMVATCPTMTFFLVNEMAGNPSPLAYLPDVMLGYTDEMTFLQRTMAYIGDFIGKLLLYNFLLPQQNSMMKEYFGEDCPSVTDILHNNTIVLINHHFSLGIPRPYIPNMIEVGGYHIRPPKPVPKDLDQFISEAKDGVILFSLGSVLQSDDLPQEKLDEILRALSRVKQRVLWKFEKENPRNLPKNVKISKWLPQSDILAHPNIKLFVTHGGLLSTTEAVFRGVPAVVIPVFGDQPMNAKLMEKIGVAVRLEYDDINEVSLYNSIQKVLNDPKYSENARMRSKMIQDRPLSPIDTAIYWMEYAMRHKGAPHLRSGATKLPWYQLEMVDVKIFILSIVIIVYKIGKKLLCCLIRRLKRKKNNVTSPKKTN